MEPLPIRDASRSTGRLLGISIVSTLTVVALSAWTAMSHSSSHPEFWLGYEQMMSTLTSPVSWLRWVLGDITEVTFYKHEFASLGLLLGAALGYWTSRYVPAWQGFSISYGSALRTVAMAGDQFPIGLITEQCVVGLEWANDQITLGAQGVVITQGTDTLEESATFFEYLWPHDTPLVLTGAMRSASEASADGPGNLLDACRVALSASSKGRGVLVVMNGEIHASLSVRKTHTLALNAFTSATGGPVGLMIENTTRFLHPGAPRMTLPIPSCTTHKVALLEASLSADTLILEQLVEMGYQGLVIAGFGAGHVSEKWSIALQAIAINLPVIVGSRTGAGTTAFHTYGFTGGEIDLIRKGLHQSGFLCPRKARLLLWLVIGCGQQSKLNDFLAYGQGCQTS